MSNHNDARTSQVRIDSLIATRDATVPQHSAPPDKPTTSNNTVTEPSSTETSLKRMRTHNNTRLTKKARLSTDTKTSEDTTSEDTETSEDTKTSEDTETDDSNQVLEDDDLVYSLFAIHAEAVMRVERRRFYRVC
ncbi:hypothetical protein FPOAC2_08681 [Fusarium poae]|jgi:hypothetical protein|uniref:Uncharacterized protein n=1 Tax=Fusarium poae TaxID=36050 RepID=A0A1B8AM31_FUSPO|nr:hypothetical protein FPOAC1_008749 [Fusarium poae]KAG8669356.1 hypothetical protein FPOAC1_008749 [Fusarium poae]OBS21583.1 hypothetical protein FPOA_07919 [Fusarium poae]